MSERDRVNKGPQHLAPTRSANAAPLSWEPPDTVILSGVCLLTYACYLHVLSYGFVYDDKPMILENPLLLSWHSIPRFFTEHLVAYLSPHSQGSYYRPLLLFWLLVNRKLWGLNAAGWHFSTLTLHVLSAVSVYLLARRILPDRYTAGLAAMIFALHPVHVESTAWVMGLPDPLMSVLFVASLLCYLNWRERRSQRWFWAAGSLCLYALAILTKEVALVLPIAIIAYEWIYAPAENMPADTKSYAKRFRASLFPAIPFLFVTIVYLLARVAVLKGLTHPMTSLPFDMTLLTWPLQLWTHLRLLLWPVGLSLFYHVPYVSHPGPINFALPLAAVAAMATLVALWARKSHEAAFAGVLLVLPLLLLLNISLFPQGEIAHDRFVYLPSVGFSLLAALAISVGISWGVPFWSRRVLNAIVFTLLALLLGAASFHYSRFWSNNLTLYQRAVEVAPTNDTAVNNLASELFERGQHDKAMELYQHVLARNPDYWLSNYNLGYCLYRLGRLQGARWYFERAIAINASSPDEFAYLGMAKYRAGELPEAVSDLRRAVALRPDISRYHFALAMVLRDQGELRWARDEFCQSLALDPRQSDAWIQIRAIDQRLSRAGQKSRQ